MWATLADIGAALVEHLVGVGEDVGVAEPGHRHGPHLAAGEAALLPPRHRGGHRPDHHQVPAGAGRGGGRRWRRRLLGLERASAELPDVLPVPRPQLLPERPVEAPVDVDEALGAAPPPAQNLLPGERLGGGLHLRRGGVAGDDRVSRRRRRLPFRLRRRRRRRGEGASLHAAQDGALGARHLRLHALPPLPLPALRHPPVVHDGARGRIRGAGVRAPPRARGAGGAQGHLAHANHGRLEDHLRLRPLRGRAAASPPREALRGPRLPLGQRARLQGKWLTSICSDLDNIPEPVVVWNF